jgi:hypothetical protein
MFVASNEKPNSQKKIAYSKAQNASPPAVAGKGVFALNI